MAQKEYRNTKFTAEDRLILKSYVTLAEGLSDYLGEGYEIVLHSLEDLEHSIIKIINGQYTGRTEGAPITNLALSMPTRIEDENREAMYLIFQRTTKGNRLKPPQSLFTVRAAK